MLAIIAIESKSIEEYARRADAWAASEAKPPSIDDIVEAWVALFEPLTMSQRIIAVRKVEAALDAARTKRIAQRDALWNKLARNINKGE